MSRLYFNTFFVFVIFLSACNPANKINKDFLYFQNHRDNLGKVELKDLPIQPNDLLNIFIYSKSLKQSDAELFNIPAGQGYIVDAKGMIELPIIGQVVASGLTLSQLQQSLQQKLLPYVKDPSVLARFQQLKINVLGEVNAPGVKSFPTDKVTILDVISLSGDLTENGRRENVMVIREENGTRKMYELDLRSANLFRSPVYQLQQNDIVYVSANNKKLKALKDKKDPIRTIQLITTIISVGASITLLITRNL